MTFGRGHKAGLAAVPVTNDEMTLERGERRQIAAALPGALGRRRPPSHLRTSRLGLSHLGGETFDFSDSRRLLQPRTLSSSRIDF